MAESVSNKNKLCALCRQEIPKEKLHYYRWMKKVEAVIIGTVGLSVLWQDIGFLPTCLECARDWTNDWKRVS